MMQLNGEQRPSHSVFNKDKFTCLSCRIYFPSQEMQRIHMKTEWHRYNLKRRVANLQPIPAEMFEEKVSNKKKDSVEVDEFGFLIDNGAVDKVRGNSHLKVKKVGPRLAALNSQHSYNGMGSRDLSPARSEISQFSVGSTVSVTSGSDIGNEDGFLVSESEESVVHYMSSNNNTDVDDEDLTDEDEEPVVDFELEECFYCGKSHESIESNVEHMFKCHGLYIPNKEKLLYRDELLRVLADSVGIDRVCLKCGYQGNKLIGIRQHIKSKGHANIPYESREERSIWSPFYESDDESDDGFEANDIELSLPNGSKLGHRSMARYHRQTHHKSHLVNENNTNEDENSLALLDKKAQDVLHMRQLIIERSEAKRIAKYDLMARSKELSVKGLKYRNKFLNYRNQKLG